MIDLGLLAEIALWIGLGIIFGLKAPIKPGYLSMLIGLGVFWIILHILLTALINLLGLGPECTIQDLALLDCGFRGATFGIGYSCFIGQVIVMVRYLINRDTGESGNAL